MRRLLLLFVLFMIGFIVEAQTKKVLVAYFSCTGRTAAVAESISKAINADLYKISPKKAYTDADLDWRNKQSRSSREMSDSKVRPELSDKKANVEAYDVVFIGFPIWWDRCPRIINSFIEAYNFKGKIVIPFATSGGSSIDASQKNLKELYTNGILWKSGKLLNNGASQASDWAKKIEL